MWSKRLWFFFWRELTKIRKRREEERKKKISGKENINDRERSYV
jgi:hypothetical protein